MRAIAILVTLQGLQSIEEYAGKLWNVFLPAKVLTGMISDDRKAGFLVINIGLFVFGLICIVAVRRNYSMASSLLWFWMVIETINGIGHPVWSLVDGGYTPGLITGLVILGVTMYLWRCMYGRRVFL